MPRLRPLRAAGGALLLATTACFPAVMHGPRVQPGLAVTVNLSAVKGQAYSYSSDEGIRLREAPVGLGIGRGWRASTPSRPSLFVGLHVPVVFPLAQVDVYAQAPERWTGPASGGVGVNLSDDHVAPYLQWGVVNARGVGWSTIQGVNVRYGRKANRTRSVVWTPGVVAHLGARPTTHLFAMAAIGRAPGDCGYYGPTGAVRCDRGPWTRAMLAGLALELRRR